MVEAGIASNGPRLGDALRVVLGLDDLAPLGQGGFSPFVQAFARVGFEGIVHPLEAWKALAARGVIPSGWPDDSSRVFERWHPTPCSGCGGDGWIITLAGWCERCWGEGCDACAVQCERCEGAGRDYDWVERKLYPVTVRQAVVLASDPERVGRAEALARAIVCDPVRAVAWAVNGRAPRDAREWALADESDLGDTGYRLLGVRDEVVLVG